MFTQILGIAVWVGVSCAHVAAGWQVDYAEAHAAARRSDKPLFIVICSSSSPYAGMVTAGTFVSEAIEESLRSDYVRLVIHTDTPAGHELAKQFSAQQTPRLVILDRSGDWQVYRESGTHTEKELSVALTKFRRSKLNAKGQPVAEEAKPVATALCRT